MSWLKQNWFKVVFLIMLALFLPYFLSDKASKITMAQPLGYNVSQTDSLACSAQLGAFIYSFNAYETVEASVQKGTDKLAIKINNDDTLTLITRAAVEVGETEGVKYGVITNDNKKLSAIYFDADGEVDSFVLNKETGIALWTKAGDFLGSRGQVIYLTCI